MMAIANRLLSSNKIALASVLVIWALVRVYPLLQTEPLMCSEVVAARKLLDYGFLDQHGARLSQGKWLGKIPNPQDFYYTHYPMPMFWLYTLIYFLTGSWGVSLFVLLLKFGGCGLVFKILDQHFDRFPAWFASVLFAVAPCSILLDCDTDLVATGAVLWPAAVWLLLRRPHAPWRAGLLVFLAGQVSWFTLTLIPALMAMTENWNRPLRATFIAVSKNRTALAILAGGVLSFLFFLGQVVFYEPNFLLLFSHLKLKAGGTQAEAVPRTLLFGLVMLRLLIFTGPALLMGLAAGLFCVRAQRQPLIMAAVVFLPSFALAAVAIPNYFYMDNIMYGSLLFPAAVLTAVAVHAQKNFLPWLLAAMAVAGIVYIHLMFSVPTVSPTARVLGKFIAAHSAPADIVGTNLELCRPPFKSFDVHGGKAAAVLADRIVVFDFASEAQLDDLPKFLRRQTGYSLIFIRDLTLPLSPELLRRLQRDGQRLAAETVVMPDQKQTWAEQMRAFVWFKVMRKAAPPPDTQRIVAEHGFEIYRLSSAQN